MSKKALFFALSVAISVCGCATENKVVSVTGESDAFEKTLQVSTINFSRPGGYNSDIFFRAIVNKETKTAVYQLYARLRADDWVYWNKAKFLIDGDLVELETDRINTDVSCKQYGCLHTEDAGVMLTRAMLNDMTSRETAVKFTGRINGMQRQFDISTDEVSAFLAKVDSFAK